MTMPIDTILTDFKNVIQAHADALNLLARAIQANAQKTPTGVASPDLEITHAVAQKTPTGVASPDLEITQDVTVDRTTGCAGEPDDKPVSGPMSDATRHQLTELVKAAVQAGKGQQVKMYLTARNAKNITELSFDHDIISFAGYLRTILAGAA